MAFENMDYDYEEEDDDVFNQPLEMEPEAQQHPRWIS